jgi:putative acyl-CoA dehydrogenase
MTSTASAPAAAAPSRASGGTHTVHNQPPPLDGFDPLACDPALASALAFYGVSSGVPSGVAGGVAGGVASGVAGGVASGVAGGVASGVAGGVAAIAALAGSGEAREHGRLANENPPRLRTHDRYGHRVDEVEFHPSWHWLLARAVGFGLHGAPWAPDAGPAAHLRRAAAFYLWSQAEAGHGCPISMTYAAVPALRSAPDLAARYEPGLRSPVYDPGLREPSGKRGLLAGMSMTEKQGGSDVRANTTSAVPCDDGCYRLTGHKWFTSAPMNDLFLTLAQAPGGLTCFLVPRVLPDGSRNGIRLMRLKDKLGNRSNASAEIEYVDAVGWRVGEEGRGVPTIIEMVSVTRLDCVLGSASGIRLALSEAAHHGAHRTAFGSRLADQPLMTAVLADLALESEAATVLAMRLAAAMDRGERDLLRLALPAAKYYVCKRAPVAVGEALECLGGNGYVEESGMPRLYREAPLNSIWEGSGNVTALDMLRAVRRSPSSVDALLTEVDVGDQRLSPALSLLRTELAAPSPSRARWLAELAALCLQASLLVRMAPDAVADAFLASRLAERHANTIGTLATTAPTRALVTRITPRHP